MRVRVIYTYKCARVRSCFASDVWRLSRYTLVDLADGDAALVDSLELVLGHLGLALGTPVTGWTAPPADAIDVLLD